MKKIIDLCFCFDGKINRMEYLKGLILGIIMVAIAFFISGLSPILVVVLIVAVITFLIMLVALSMKRLRDIGWPTWLAILNFVPVLTHIFWLILLVVPGKTDDAKI